MPKSVPPPPTFHVSVATLRREVDRAIAARRREAPERFIGLQVVRLHKAPRVADHALEQGELSAVAPFLKVVAELDRHHGWDARLVADPRAAAALSPPAPAPLALTREHADSCRKTHPTP